MAALKRTLDESPSAQKTKKPKTSQTKKSDSVHAVSSLTTDEIDFPRGGGTSFTPLEVKAIRAEAVKEANTELFDDSQLEGKKIKKPKRKSEAHASAKLSGERSDHSARIEHLNYKRISIGMKIFGQIMSIQPLALIVSLPNQLSGYIPITNISSQYTTLLEKMDVDEDSEEQSEYEAAESEPPKSRIPDLADMFHPGQYVRAAVTAIHASGSSDPSGISKSRDSSIRSSRRVELTLFPEEVNAGVQKSDLKADFTLSAAVKSVEDHGYLLDLGVPDVSGFLSFKDAQKQESRKPFVGQIIDVTVSSVSKNGRTRNVTLDRSTFNSSSLTEISNLSSLLPGTLVQALITAVHPNGFNLQVLGFFDGTVDEFHLPRNVSEKSFKVGKKVKARVLYNIPLTSPPKLALSLKGHVINLDVCRAPGEDHSDDTPILQDAYPIGRILDDVKVLRVENERGLTVQSDSGVEGFVHISHVSDDHLPSLSASGSWKPGSLHRARVLGYFPLDGLLQLSLKSSVLSEKYLRISDIRVGEVLKGTIKKLSDTGLFVSLSGNIDGVVWPKHYADITLKHPLKRFKIGSTIKCRVLVVDDEHQRVLLTAKKTLIESDLPIIASIEDATVGMVVHATVLKPLTKSLIIEFYNNVKAVVPIKEVSEEPVSNLPSLYAVGKAVKVRVIAVDKEKSRILASIRQSGGNFKEVNNDISGIEIGSVVEGTVTQIQKDNAVLAVHPGQACALISLNNLANHRDLSLAQLRVVLKVDEKLDNLVVVSRNTEKGFVIVANKPKPKAVLSKGALSIDSVQSGQIVGARVVRHMHQGVLLKVTSHIGGILYPTDSTDNYDVGNAFPPVDSVLKGAVVAIDETKKQLTLSTRGSRISPSHAVSVVDREIIDLADLHVGETVRGFIKSITEHGLFVTIGRNIDARVQIRELFDDFVKDWKTRFQSHEVVKGRILSVDNDARKVEMTLRSGELSKPVALTLSTLAPGQKIEGTVKRIEDYGLFIQIEGSKLSGLCHRSELSDNKDADTAVALRGFRENDHVRAMVLDVKDKRISLSLKPSHFSADTLESIQHSDDDNGITELAGAMSGDEDQSVPDYDEEQVSSEDEEDAMQIDVDLQPRLQQPRTSDAVKPSTGPLRLSTDFQWFGSAANSQVEDSEESSDESDGSLPSKKKKNKRKEIELDLTAEMHSKTPESNADFERLILGSPNSSYLWIQYMSFQLQLSEIDKAREIGRRALDKISFREEAEKLNVWTALLNLENVYGTTETLDKVFKEAARANDSKTVYLRLASILDQSDKHDKAEEQYKRTCKKFSLSSKVWTLFAEHYLRRGEIEESRKLLPRSLQSLDRRKHLKTISRFAQLEYKLGDPERGKTLFEGIVDSHPKRWDMWFVYMDMEAGQSNLQSLRNLFDRVLQVKMTNHKAKSFFKKWLELERRLGDEEGADMVKQKAIEWTQKSSLHNDSA